MLVKSITYKDYNGLERTENFYFNLTKSELIEMDAMIPGGMNNAYKMIMDGNDTAALMSTFKTIILKAYGVKSADGRRFQKSKEISEAFEQSPAYDKLFMELITNDEKAMLNFVRGIMPEDMQKDAEDAEKQLLQSNSSAT